MILSNIVQGMAQQIGTLAVAASWAVLLLPFRWLARRAAKPVSIYVSCNLDDLGRHRQAIADRIKGIPATVEGDPLNALQPQLNMAERTQLIRNCDLFIGMYAWQYGPIVEGTQSYPEQELRVALNQQPERRLWLLPERGLWPGNRQDSNRDAAGSPISRLRAAVSAETTRPLSTDEAAVANEVASQVIDYQRRKHPAARLRADLLDFRAFVLAGVMTVLVSLYLTLTSGADADARVLMGIALGSGVLSFAARFGVSTWVLRP